MIELLKPTREGGRVGFCVKKSWGKNENKSVALVCFDVRVSCLCSANANRDARTADGNARAANEHACSTRRIPGPADKHADAANRNSHSAHSNGNTDSARTHRVQIETRWQFGDLHDQS